MVLYIPSMPYPLVFSAVTSTGPVGSRVLNPSDIHPVTILSVDRMILTYVHNVSSSGIWVLAAAARRSNSDRIADLELIGLSDTAPGIVDTEGVGDSTSYTGGI